MSCMYEQLQDGLRPQLMRSPNVSGALKYKELCMFFSSNEEKHQVQLKKRQQYDYLITCLRKRQLQPFTNTQPTQPERPPACSQAKSVLETLRHRRGRGKGLHQNLLILALHQVDIPGTQQGQKQWFHDQPLAKIWYFKQNEFPCCFLKSRESLIQRRIQNGCWPQS